MNEHSCMIDKQGKKWVVNGYYLDGNDIWTLLISFDDRTKTKKVKGML